jgi:hypothetical protein
MPQAASEFVEKIVSRDKVFAVIIRAALPHEGYNFVSEDKDSMQVGVNHYKAHTIAKPHFHPPLERQVFSTVEVLHIDSGEAVLQLYDDDQRRLHKTVVGAGDTIILLAGGHALEFSKDTRIVEVKQGPYFGREKDKIFFKDSESETPA